MMRPMILLAFALAAITSPSTAQHLPWSMTDGQHRHVVGATAGFDTGSYLGLSYAYRLPWRVIPMAITADGRAPFGSDVLDDWQLGLGVQARPWRDGVLSLEVGAGLRVRRYESSLARLHNAGFGANASFGAEWSRWSVMATATHESSSLTHIEHKLMKDYYPEVRDGWYDADAGIFRFGVSTGVAIRSWSVELTAGRMFGDDFDSDPVIPLFAAVALRKPL
jgi:hypothetical protein